MNPGKIIYLFVAAVALLLGQAALAKDCFVYFGTFTNESSKGIYMSRLDTDTGRLSVPEVAAEVPSPNYLAASADGKFLYAATRSETFNGLKGGSVSAFTADAHTGGLKLLDQKYCGGEAPCHVSVDPAGRTVFVANYYGGSVKSFRVNSDGTLTDGTFIQHHGSGVNASRQDHAYAHCMVPAPDGRFVLACDLGMDKVMIYKFDGTNAALTASKPAFARVPPDSGARHLAFSPDGRFVYVINEMGCTVTTFAWDAKKGKLKPRETVSLLPQGMIVTNTFAAAEIVVRPDGRFVYGTVRGYDSIAVLAVDAKSGKLSLVENVPCGGNIPRGMGIDPTGRWLLAANQKSGIVAVFGIDEATGKLTPTGQVVPAGTPVDVKFVEVQP
jgi:6-phosphogluconolactonase